MAVASEERTDITVREFSAASGWTHKHCYELCWREIIPAVRVNGKWRISRLAAEKYIAQRKNRKKAAKNGQE